MASLPKALLSATIFGLVIAVPYTGVAAAALVAPTISGDTSTPECSDAFRLATAMFNARSPRLYAPLIIPSGMNSELILGARGLDISGGAALEASDDQFQKVPHFGRHVYWERAKETGSRIAVTESPRGWRGDTYALYLLNAHVSKADFIRDADPYNGKPTHKPLIDGAWRPPLVFLHTPSQKKWFLEVGAPYVVLPNWFVYKETEGMYSHGCTISFLPEGVSALSLLPEAVRNFARLLDETIGPGKDEGTLQPTARLRLHVQNVWANAAVRPWALSESDTYNSTQEAQAGLFQWSASGRSYKRIYDQILRSYPAAERALAAYYTEQFRLPKGKADSLAKWILDIAFRANFVFPNGSDYFRYDNVNTNPW